jgi:hypothetical protein
MSTITLLSLPSELLLEIILRARDVDGAVDRCTLTSLFVSCRAISDFMQTRWVDIVDRYTKIITYLSVTRVEYRFCGLLHRRDGPAVVHGDSQSWYQYDLQRRDDDLPATVNEIACHLVWRMNDKYHRNTDLPAVYHGSIWEWYIHGDRRRIPTYITGPIRVRIVWDRRDTHRAIRLWDGVSDVSAADFDWGSVIGPQSLPPAMNTRIEYQWMPSGGAQRDCHWKLINIGGRYVVDRSQ